MRLNEPTLTDGVISKYPIKEYPVCIGSDEPCKMVSPQVSGSPKQGSIPSKMDDINVDESQGNSNHGIFCVTGKDLDCIDIPSIKNRLNISYKLRILYSNIKFRRYLIMKIDTNTMVSITEANQNFSKVARLVDEHGTAVILKNNVPRYLVIDFSTAEKDSVASDEDVLNISKRLIEQNREAYEVLAK